MSFILEFVLDTLLLFFCSSWKIVTVKKLYELDPYVEWLPFLNEVFNPAIRIYQHTQVNFVHAIS